VARGPAAAGLPYEPRKPDALLAALWPGVRRPCGAGLPQGSVKY